MEPLKRAPRTMANMYDSYTNEEMPYAIVLPHWAALSVYLLLDPGLMVLRALAPWNVHVRPLDDLLREKDPLG